MTKLKELQSIYRVSPWLDNLSRSLIANGTLDNYILSGVRGVTSNPSIFEKSFGSGEYTSALQKLITEGRSIEEAYWSLAIEDIQATCDKLMPLYNESDKNDGYVSLEVSPALARSADQTVTQAQDLWAKVSRPNLMIKIPATEQCIPAISTVISLGINVNVTLIFSLHRYLQVITAYMDGLEKASNPSSVRSVASFFISRVDTEIDPRLTDASLQGTAAVAQARAAYGIFLESFNPLSDRWSALASKGALPQRPLWASTSTKNPDYPDLKYVESLLTPGAVNTLPNATLDAILDHAQFDESKIVSAKEIELAHEQLALLSASGIDMREVSTKLEDEGVAKFTEAFSAMLNALQESLQPISQEV